MTLLRFTLVSDGSSDKALIPVLKWLVAQHAVNVGIDAQWADLRNLPRPPRALDERIQLAVKLYPCDLLFVHRDAEGQPAERRYEEIRDALRSIPDPPAVCVVPVRMMEAWLLFDEKAVRWASDNPNGRMPLNLPAIRDVERVPDPKAILHDALKSASGLPVKRRQRFRIEERVHRVADLIEDFAPLRQAPAFHRLEQETGPCVRELIGQ
jgi:hypothetical protein